MKLIKMDKGMDFKQKLLLCLYWTNRKAVRTEGCAPFLIRKIVTCDAIFNRRVEGKSTYMEEGVEISCP